MTDDELVKAIAVYPFEERGGHPVLPARSDPLGLGLYRGVVQSNGILVKTLSAEVKAALEARGFEVVPVEGRDGTRYGLARNTLRAGGQVPDDQLVQLIAVYPFEERDGRPVLPPRTHPLGGALLHRTVASDDSLNTELSAGVKAALEAKGFQVVPVKVSNNSTRLRYGLHKDTLRATRTRQPQRETLGQAQAVPLQAATAGPQAPQQAIAGGHRLENAPQNWGEQFAETVTHVNSDVPQQNTDRPSFGFPHEYDWEFVKSVVEAAVDEAGRNGLIDDYVRQQIAHTARTAVPSGQSPARQAPPTQEQVNYAWQARTAHMMNPPGGGPSQGR
ncbi:hypothetical protein [Streptomyces bauhiniae]